jgi:hypothetical protein
MGGSAEEVSGAVGLVASAAAGLAASAAAGLAASAAVDLVVSADSVGASDVSAVVDSDVVSDSTVGVWWVRVLLPLLLLLLLASVLGDVSFDHLVGECEQRRTRVEQA